MFNWYKKKRLDEQVEFFGGTRKKFVSIYARQVKPRIRVKTGNYTDPLRELANHYGSSGQQGLASYLAQEASIRGQQLANLQAYQGTNLSALGAQQSAAMANMTLQCSCINWLCGMGSR